MFDLQVSIFLLLLLLSSPADPSSSFLHSIGTNSGTSVLSVIETLSLIAQRSIKIIVGPRRPGDLGMVVCSAEKAERELGWKATRGLGEMCRDLVGWQAVSLLSLTFERESIDEF